MSRLGQTSTDGQQTTAVELIITALELCYENVLYKFTFDIDI